MNGKETSDEINAAAAEWAVRVDETTLEGQEQAALEAWLAQDARRLGAFARARAILMGARRLRSLTSGTPGSFDESEPQADGAEDDDGPSGWMGRRAMVAGGAAAVLGGVIWNSTASSGAEARTYETAKGEVRVLPLSDGSRVTLNTSSRLTTRFNLLRRHMELEEGEAYFEVAKDRLRPFVVLAGLVRTEAVGTRFSVQHIRNRPIEVTVDLGLVEVGLQTSAATRSRRIGANTRLISNYDDSFLIEPVDSHAVDRQLAWREGMLAFEDTPLEQAVREFARYSDIGIGLANEQIGRETITGLFAARDPVGFAEGVALSLGLHVETGSNVVLLKP